MNNCVSLSIGAFQKEYGDIEALRIAKQIGLSMVDFSLPRKKVGQIHPIFEKSQEEIIEYYTNVKKEADSLGVKIGQTHGVISGFTKDELHNKYLLENAYNDCLVTNILGAKYCVMHSVTTIHHGKDADQNFMRDLNFDMFCKILPFAREFGIKIATETFGDATGLDCIDFFGNIDEFINSFERISAVEDFSKYFCVCVDTGHTNKAMRFGQPSPADVIRKLGKRVEVLHLNDNDGMYDQHLIPKSGNIDWDDVLSALKQIGYNYSYNMEVSLGRFGDNLITETASFAVKVMENMLNNRK